MDLSISLFSGTIKENKLTFLLVKEIKNVSVAIIWFAILGSLYFFSHTGGEVAGTVTVSPPIFPTAERVEIKVPTTTDAEMPPEIGARAVLVQDFRSRRTLFSKNSDEKLPTASLTKLVTSLVALKTLSPEESITITESDVNVPLPRANLRPGERWTVEDLVTASLVASANDAAQALARAGGKGSTAAFVKSMNEFAAELGMHDTSFTNPEGFDNDLHYSTASDLSLLVFEFLQHAELAAIVREKKATIGPVGGGRSVTLTTTNKLLLEHEEVLGIKTGYTTKARGNLILLLDELDGGERVQYFSIILGSNAREDESEKILNWVRQNVVWQ